MIILGDAGINYYGSGDRSKKKKLQQLPITFFCIHGNHEQRPEAIGTYELEDFHGVLSHTCPLKYEPVEVFLPMIDQSTVDKSTEMWLDEIEQKLHYEKWYCGHYHTEKHIDKMRFMFNEVEMLK